MDSPSPKREGDLVTDAPIEAQREMREDLVETLGRELLGPFGGPAEVLRQRPTSRYLLGRLAPAGTRVSREEDEGTADTARGADSADTGYASPISMAMNPSSIGLSFTLGPEVNLLSVTAEWGTYSEDKVEVERKDGRTGQATAWARKHHSETVDVSVSDSGERDLGGEVRLQWLCRSLPDGRRRAMSVFLVNRVRSRNPSRPDDSEWLFQPRLSIRHRDGEAIFEARSLDDVIDIQTLDADRSADELKAVPVQSFGRRSCYSGIDPSMRSGTDAPPTGTLRAASVPPRSRRWSSRYTSCREQTPEADETSTSTCGSSAERHPTVCPGISCGRC